VRICTDLKKTLKDRHQPSKGKKEIIHKSTSSSRVLPSNHLSTFFYTTHCVHARRLFGLSEDTTSEVTLAEVELDGALLGSGGLRECG
jgi:hypothetical protein